MRLSVSNIGWSAENDGAVYDLMEKFGFEGLEIAPTRILPEAPYDRTDEAAQWAYSLRKSTGLTVCSMQSIWFGRSENIFGAPEEREALAAYTAKASRFAQAVGCGHLVFGCPRSRNMPDGADPQTAVGFFRRIARDAASCGAVVGMEANPPIYNTNYINDTPAALRLVDEVGEEGFLLNLDVGTMVQNGEPAALLRGAVGKVHHVHISEPGLAPVEPRRLHGELCDVLRAEGYDGFVSIEMKNTGDGDLSRLEAAMRYVKEIFG